MFDVKSYGALGNGVTDDTAAIQSALNACHTAGGGDVYFPNGIYIIDGNLQTNIGGVNPNSQLYIPPLYPDPTNQTTINATFGNRTHIRLVGETIPNLTANGVLIDFEYSKKGVILKSTINLARVSGTNPSILGGIDILTSFGNINYNYVTIENLNFIVPHDTNGPLMCGINAQDIASTSFNRVNVMVGRSYVGYPQPTRDVAAILTGRYNTDGQSFLTNSGASGFKYGIVVSEHIVIDQVTIAVCEYGLIFFKVNHAGLIERISTHWCKHQMLIVGTQPFFGKTYGTGAGPVYIQINQFDCESRTNGDWYDYSSFIVDTSDVGRGYIKYHILNANDSKIRPDLFSKSGGIHIFEEALGFEKRRIYSQKSPGPAVVNTTSPIELYPTRNMKEKLQYAYAPKPGDEIIFKSRAYVTTAASNNTLTFGIQVGLTIYPATLNFGNSYNNVVDFEISCKYITTGATGTLKIQGVAILANGTRLYIDPETNLTVNTVGDNVISLIAQWGNASPSNSIQFQNSSIDLI